MCEGPSALGVKVRLVTQSPVASVPLFFWLTVLVTTGVYAQISDSPGSVSCPPAVNLTVTVTTEDGAAVIPNALVILREDTLGQPRGVKVFELELRTDENGKATAPVPCNYLDVFVGHDGFAPVAQKFLITKDAHTFSVPLKMYRWVTRTTEIEVPSIQSEETSEMPPLPSTIPESTSGETRKAGAVKYQSPYGFCFSLPEDWKGFSIAADHWEGFTSCSTGSCKVTQGPLVIIRNPKCAQPNSCADIPIMVFTLEQWKHLGEFQVSAAPFPPGELGRNRKYVFALPARYNYGFLDGWEQVDSILKGHALHAPCSK